MAHFSERCGLRVSLGDEKESREAWCAAGMAAKVKKKKAIHKKKNEKEKEKES